MTVDEYVEALPEKRRERLHAMRDCFRDAVAGVDETMKYKMPTYEKGDNTVSIGNQKHYICAYFCCEELIRDIKENHPHLNCGTGCVRIRDTQEIPFADLKRAFVKAMKFKK